MYPWATPEKCLDDMSLPQLIKYYNKGWDAKKFEAKVHWGIYCEMISGEHTGDSNSRPDIEEIRRYPGYENAHYDKNGKFVKG